MRLLLDTHILLWMFFDPKRIAENTRVAMANIENELIVSDVSLWEIAIKVRAGKLNADLVAIMDEIDHVGIRRLALSHVHLRRLLTLAKHHKDPFDHLIITQAIVEQLTLITSDQEIQKYPVKILSG